MAGVRFSHPAHKSKCLLRAGHFYLLERDERANCFARVENRKPEPCRKAGEVGQEPLNESSSLVS